jgi:hypothetical protein
MLPLQLGFHPWTIPEAIFGAAKRLWRDRIKIDAAIERLLERSKFRPDSYPGALQ